VRGQLVGSALCIGLLGIYGGLPRNASADPQKDVRGPRANQRRRYVLRRDSGSAPADFWLPSFARGTVFSVCMVGDPRNVRNHARRRDPSRTIRSGLLGSHLTIGQVRRVRSRHDPPCIPRLLRSRSIPMSHSKRFKVNPAGGTQRYQRCHSLDGPGVFQET
jgi:hypothetical protein